eukprot:3778157-Prorocentrum_lima.AAC.1
MEALADSLSRHDPQTLLTPTVPYEPNRVLQDAPSQPTVQSTLSQRSPGHPFVSDRSPTRLARSPRQTRG